MSDHGRMQTPRPDVADPHLPPRVASFRTRRSTLSGGQQTAWERLWPEMGMHARDGDDIRLVRGDGVDVLEHMFGPDSLTGVRVFFPDPWPKARHHKRRLLQPATVALIADRLRPGGVLHAATDHAGYAEQIAEVGDAEPRLRRVTASDTLPISVQRPITKYEGKAQHAGSAVAELLWEKSHEPH